MPRNKKNIYFACHGKSQEHMPITIKRGAYIGMRASIISKNSGGGTHGVIIGENAIVGACTLVNKDIPNGATAVGVPCRILARSQYENLEVLQSCVTSCDCSQ